jgi:hypothetical protein
MTTPANHYKNFDAAIYARVYEVLEMRDLDWLKARFDVMSTSIRVSKVYLETHRDRVIADEAILSGAIDFFSERGVRTSGGITITVNERNRFETYCYTNPEHRQKLKEVIAYTAGLFDEVILDDFFFTNCKCESCIEARGDQSWTQFRLNLLTEAARDLVIEPARQANPDVELVIKYPNWYEHFQGLGFDLESGPRLFDRLYTGTETRDPRFGNQHLQQVHGYTIFRYFEHLKPGANGGGWVDTGGMTSLDRYAEQLWLTLFAKAPEITLFDFRQLQRPILPGDRAAWQGNDTSFDFDRMIAPVSNEDGSWPQETTIALAAGYALAQVDEVLDHLGNPVGVPCYKPYHSTGEDFLQSYLGMVGIPIDLVSTFPAHANTILLTESAKHDPEIVEKIEKQLRQGKTVVITSGLLRSLQDRGLRQIVELEYTDRKALVEDYQIGWFQRCSGTKPVLIPQITYLTNDSWEEISAKVGFNGYPLLHSAQYAGGILYILTVPEQFSDLYLLPVEVLNRIRSTLLQEFYVRIESPGQVALFVYDNGTFIIESFQDESVDANIVLPSALGRPQDLETRENFTGDEILDWRRQPTGEMRYPISIKPHSYRLLRCRTEEG